MVGTLDETSAPGWRIEWHDDLESTQDEIVERADPDRLVVAARTQSRGRGRRGRDWESPEGGLWFSFAFLRGEQPDPFLGLLVAEALRSAIAREGQTAIKWPNDLVTDGSDWQCKWAGILATTRTAEDAGTLYLFGVGANLEIPREALPKLDRPVTSILAEFGRSPSPAEALPLILSNFDELLRLDEEAGRRAVIERITPRIATIGRPVRWQQDGEAHHGQAIGIGPEGGLRVRRASGVEMTLHANEVEHLRNHD